VTSYHCKLSVTGHWQLVTEKVGTLPFGDDDLPGH
jgi:hypothetical protein